MNDPNITISSIKNTPTANITINTNTSGGVTSKSNTSTKTKQSKTSTKSSSTNNNNGATTTSTTKKSKPRKKKSSTKSKSGGSSTALFSSNQTISAAALTKKAKSLHEKLILEKEVAFHDKAWLSSNSHSYPYPYPHPHPSHPNKKQKHSTKHNHHPLNTVSPSFLEQDLDIVQKALQANGLSLSNISKEAFGVLLESARKYALNIIHDATDYSMLASKDEITPADLLLAHEMQLEDSGNGSGDGGYFGTTTNINGYNEKSAQQLHHLSQIADDVNKIMLPPIPDECFNGIVLPPPEYNLLGRTFDIVVKRSNMKNSGSGSNGHGHGGDISTTKNDSSGAADQNDKNIQQQLTSTGTSQPSSTLPNVDAGGDVIMSNMTKEDVKNEKSTLAYGANRGPQIEINLKPKES